MTTHKKFKPKTPKILPKYVEKTVITEILDKAKKDSYRNYIILLTLWRTGVRVEELVNLKKDDLREGTIIIREGKNKKDRVIPLESELGNILGVYTDSKRKSDNIFNIKQRQVRNVVYKYDKSLHPHTFRHSFAVYCLKHNMNVRSLQKILGHDNISTTMIYLDVIAKDVKDDFDGVEW